MVKRSPEDERIEAHNLAIQREHAAQLKDLKFKLQKVSRAKNVCRREKRLLEDIIKLSRKEVRIAQNIIKRMDRTLRAANVLMDDLEIEPIREISSPIIFPIGEKNEKPTSRTRRTRETRKGEGEFVGPTPVLRR